MDVLLEYVWLDGYETTNLRSKVKAMKVEEGWEPSSDSCPEWNFDGSSTEQAEGSSSECLLRPVRLYPWKENHYLVLCEVFDAEGKPHVANARAKLRENFPKNELEFWWGFEQEYFITKDFQPLGFPKGGYPRPQGLYYCGVGGNQVRGRELAENHLEKCLSMGIELTGMNAEVAVGQWEFQCFAKDTLKACDDLWISRYVLYRMSEPYGCDIDMEPKPILGDWNGSGCHTNFSNALMREGGEDYFLKVLESLGRHHAEHIKEYGSGNEKRLTGLHETQHIDKFSWGVADRGSSIRVPTAVEKDGWKGYLEDRRPASNCDPYRVARLITSSVVSV